MPCEITTIIKTTELTARNKELEYESFNPNNPDDPIMEQHRKTALSKLQVRQEDIEDMKQNIKVLSE